MAKRNKAKKCELCEGEAKTHCESDGASLCWGCDARVHGANFLVAKHRRSLLCRLCHSPTPWSASGPSLSPTVSLCQPCFLQHYDTIQQHDNNDPHHDDDDDDEEEDMITDHNNDRDEADSDDDNDDDDEMSSSSEEEEDEENQVVPWSKPAHSASNTKHSHSPSNLFARQARN